jgi:hypothetical protein
MDLRKASLGSVSAITINPQIIRYKNPYLVAHNPILEFRVPDEVYPHPVIRAFCAYLQSAECAKNSIATISRKVNSFKILCEYIAQYPDRSDINDDGAIFPSYINFLKIDKKKTVNPIATFLVELSVAMKHVCDPRHNYSQELWWHDNLYRIKNEYKPIKQDVIGTQMTLFDLHQSSEFSDEEILLSLRYVTLWFIHKMESVRQDHLDNCSEVLKYLLPECESKSIMERGAISYAGQRLQKRAPFFQKAVQYQLHEYALANCPIMTELHYYNPPIMLDLTMLNGAASMEAMRDELKAMNGKKATKEVKMVRKKYGINGYINHAYESPQTNTILGSKGLNVFSINGFFAHTTAEQIAMSWYLASARVQSSGLDGLVLDNFITSGGSSSNPKLIELNNEAHYDETGQIKFSKARAKSNFVTPLIKRGEPEFDITLAYIERINQSIEYGLIADRENALFNLSQNSLGVQTRYCRSNSTLPLWLLGIKGSHMQSLCLAEVSKARPFISLLEQHVSRVYQNTQQTAEYDKLKRWYKAGVIKNKPVFGEIVPSLNAITTSFIAQSRALLEDDPSDTPAVTAAASAHSKKTHTNTYVNRNDSTNKIKAKAETFGQDVGDEMIRLATNLSRYRENIEVVAIDKVEEVIGFKPTESMDATTMEGFDLFLEAIGQNVADIGSLAEVNVGSTTYIIQSPITAALMMAYVNHIDTHIDELARDSEARHRAAIAHKMYLNHLLDKFPEKMKREAKKINQEYSFPFASLL